MLKEEDLQRNKIQKNQLSSFKPIKTSPVKFVSPPQQLAESLHILAEQQKKHHQTRSNLLKQLKQAPSVQTEIQLHHLQKRISNITRITNTVLTHLTLHKKTNAIALYHNAATPHTANVVKVGYENYSFWVNLPNSYVQKHFAHCPYRGQVAHDPSASPVTPDIHPDEALYICNQYHKEILLYKKLAKEKNQQIQIHNTVLKKMKVRLDVGALQLVAPPQAKPQAKPEKAYSKDHDRHQGEFKMRKKFPNVA